MKKTWAWTLLPLAMIATWPTAVRADDPAAVISRWDAAWAKVNDFYDGTHAHIVKGNRVEDRTYRIWFKKPMNLRTEIIKGNRGGDNGSVAVYTGGDKVTGHQGGLFAGISLSLGLDDTKTTSIRGGRITDLQFGHHLDIIHSYERGKARMDLSTGTVGGHAVTILTCYSDSAGFIAGNDNIDKDVFAYDDTLNLPLQWTRYEPDGTKAADTTYYDLKVNIGVPDNAFQVRTRMTPP